MNLFEFIGGREGPSMSAEFRRVQALPARDWTLADDLDELIPELTRMLKTPEGAMALRQTQAAALREIYDFRGLFGPIAVGEGKSLITLLAPVVCQSSRPVLLVPAALRDQTNRKVIPEMRKHWMLHEHLRVVGYSELSLARNAELLQIHKPDMIIADECHYLKNRKSGRTRRVMRYMRENPYTVFVAVSGTVANHSIMDYWHIIQWALKPHNTPLPRNFYDAVSWSEALDERVHPRDRRQPGVLKQFCINGENVRQGYRRRLSSTPGVLATGETKLGVSLRVFEKKLKAPRSVVSTISDIYEFWETPDGDVISEAVDLWRHARTALCGFYYRWNPEPPAKWLIARKAWKQYVQHVLKRNRRGLDTELQVWNACERGKLESEEFLLWRPFKGTFKLNSEPVWISDYMVKDAAQWLKEPGICWVEHIAFGKELARVSGAPYFGAGNTEILDCDAQPIIASIDSHKEGKNLQDRWHRNLVTCPPTSGKTWEQLLGRTHRQGQQADEVTYEVYHHHPTFIDAMEQAVADATFLQDSLGNQQRLLYCDRSIP